LNYNSPVPLHRGNLFLIGLMGAGKSTLGRQLARRMRKRFVDVDTELEARTGVSIPTIFEIEGEKAFRDREEALVAELTGLTNIVLATGGGAVVRPVSRENLRRNGTVIYLHAEPEELFRRVGQSRNRPMLRAADPQARLAELYEQRDPLYREVADYVVRSNREEVLRFVRMLDGAYDSRQPT
jgi:shikimate kinase